MVGKHWLEHTFYVHKKYVHKMLVDCKTYWLSTEIYERRRQNWQINFSINHDKHTIAITYVKFTFLYKVYTQRSNYFPGLVSKNPRTFKKNSPLILTRPTPVLRKIHKMGAPLFNFQPRTPHDPITPLEELLSRSKMFFFVD